MKRSPSTQCRIEPLERRALLSVPSLAAIRAAVGPGISANLLGSNLDLTVAPQSGRVTPSVTARDPHPAITPSGFLAPFSSTGPIGLTPAQIRRAYGLDSIQFGSVVGDGSGQTIAIIDCYDDPTAQADLHQFSVAFGLPDPPGFTKINETGGGILPAADSANNGWGLETSLDLQWAHATAPAAALVLIEAAEPSDAAMIQTATQTAKNLPGVVAISMSWGRPEDPADPSLNSLFNSSTGHPVTFVASTGDAGSPAQFPSYSPNVVAAGGTSLSVDPAGNYLSESAWSHGGGGVSAYQPGPSYQFGFAPSSRRAVPDISVDADPQTGVPVYDSFDYGTAAPWVQVGGTSLSAPVVSGMVALAAQLDAVHGLPAPDGTAQVLPRIYQTPSAMFRDVTTGNDGNPAGPGYDLATGRGSPIGPSFVNALAAVGPTYSVTAGSLPVTLRCSPDGSMIQIWTTSDPAAASPDATVSPAEIGSLVVTGDLVLDESNGPVTAPGGILVTGNSAITIRTPAAGTTLDIGAGVVLEPTSDASITGVFSAVTIQGQSADRITRTGPSGPTLTVTAVGNLDLEAGSAVIPAGPAGGGVHVVGLTSLVVRSTASLALTAAANRSDRTLLDVAHLTADPGAQLDVSTNDVIVRGGTTADPFTSSYSDTTGLTAVAVVTDNGLFTAARPFDGVTPAPADTLVRLTLTGDANLDGVVDGSDYARLDYSVLTAATGWSAGDFNHDGVVDGSDFTLIDNSFNHQTGVLPVPSTRVATPALPTEDFRRKAKKH